MKNFINLGVIIVSICLLSLVNTIQSNNRKLSEKLKLLITNILNISYVILLSSGILFIIFQAILYILNINELMLDVMIVSIYGALIVYCGDYISKPILRRISYNNFSREYGGKTLTEKEMEEIREKYKKSFLYWNYILKFLISGLLYSLIYDVILKESNLIVVILMSLTSVIFYGTLFKRINR